MASIRVQVQSRKDATMRQNFRMVSLLVCILSLTDGQRNDYFLGSSVAEAIRTGVTIVSRFLNPKPIFRKIVEDMRQARKGHKDGDEFVWLMLRVMGVEPGKITDFAVDGVFSIILLMSKVLLRNEERKRKKRKTFKNSSLFHFILNQPQVVDLLTLMQDPNLVELVMKESTEKLKNQPKENVECLKLLICRTKPFVQGMQRSLKFFANRENMRISGEASCQKMTPDEKTCRKEEKEEEDAWERESLEDRMYFFMPSLEETVKAGDECERLYPNCLY